MEAALPAERRPSGMGMALTMTTGFAYLNGNLRRYDGGQAVRHLRRAHVYVRSPESMLCRPALRGRHFHLFASVPRSAGGNDAAATQDSAIVGVGTYVGLLRGDRMRSQRRLTDADLARLLKARSDASHPTLITKVRLHTFVRSRVLRLTYDVYL